MELGVMKDAIAGGLAEADLLYCYSANLGWNPAQALAPLGAKAVCHDDLDALVAAHRCRRQPGDQVLIMSNRGSAGFTGNCSIGWPAMAEYGCRIVDVYRRSASPAIRCVEFDARGMERGHNAGARVATRPSERPSLLPLERTRRRASASTPVNGSGPLPDARRWVRPT